MDQAALQGILESQRQWMERMMEANRVSMEKVLKEHSSPSTSSSIPQFRAFDMEKESWDSYLFQLQQHFTANSLEDDSLRKAHFLSTSGNQINDLLKKLVGAEEVSRHTFKDLSAKLTKHFQSKMHVLASRCKFLKQKMGPGQSYAEWIADLRGLARDCVFVCSKPGCGTSYADVMIRDMVTYYTPHDSVRIAATQKKNPTLEEIEEIVTAYESTQLASSILKGSSTSYPSMSSEVNQMCSTFQQKVTSKCNDIFSIRKSCPSCFIQHQRNMCKHLDSICDLCHRRGHISSVCLSAKSANTSHAQQPHQPRPHSKSRGRRALRYGNANQKHQKQPNFSSRHKPLERTNFISEVVNNIVFDNQTAETVSSAQLETDKNENKILVLLHVNERPLTFQLDTGATCSLISLDGYNSLGNPHCESTTRSLRAYGEVAVPVKGVINVNVQWKKQTRNLPLLVCDIARGANIMGLDWFQAFGLQIHITRSNSVLQLCSDPKGQLLSDALSLCKKHEEVFKPELGCSKMYVAHLTMKPNTKPKYFKYRPLPFAQKETVRRELDRLRQMDILRPVETSQWAAPIVVVKKANGSVRICGDFKITINPQLEIDRHPVPRIQELFCKLQGGRYFTKIDLSDAYLQIPLDEPSKKVCVVSTEFGLFEYQRLPFGTSSSTGIFQRYMEQLTADLEFCVSYLDDVIVSGRTNQEHLGNLKVFLERLEKHGLRCRLEKCEFAKSEIEYLGHIIDENGIRPSDTRVKAIINMPEPRNLKDLEAFIGKLNYYNQFIENFAQLAAPLNKLRAKAEFFKWGDDQQKSFDLFKEKILQVSRLVHFQEDLPITLATDASSHGIGAVISHVFADGTEKPIAFASKTLDAAQRRYSQIEKEALSIIFGVTKFHQYLYGRQFELITDHQPLVTIFNPCKKLPHMTIQRLQRWAILLMGYTYTIRYRPTMQHGNADCLSRLPMGPDEDFDHSEESCHQVDESAAVADFPINAGVIARFSKQDEDIRKVIEYVQHGWPSHLSEAESHLLPYFRRRLCLSVSTNILLFHSENLRVVIPAALQKKVLALLHQGHWGTTRMKQMARRHCWWPNIDVIITESVAKCSVCQLNASRSPKEYSSWPSSDGVWERIHVDYAGPFQKFMWLVVVDSKSKFPFVVQMSSTTSQATIHALRTIFAQEGLPRVIVSDNGTQFSSKEFQQFCQDHSIRHMTSAPFNPESNGLAERMVRTFKTAFLKIMEDPSKDNDALSTFLSTYRATPDETGISPAEKLHGRQHRTLLSAIFPEPQKSLVIQHPLKPKFSIGQPVFVQQYLRGKKWTTGHIEKIFGRRMYYVHTEAGFWRRHQNQIRPRTVGNSTVPTNETTDIEQASSHNFFSKVNLSPRDTTPTPSQHQRDADNSDLLIYPDVTPTKVDLTEEQLPSTPKTGINREVPPTSDLPAPAPVRPPSPRRSERLRSKRVRFTSN